MAEPVPVKRLDVGRWTIEIEFEDGPAARAAAGDLRRLAGPAVRHEIRGTASVWLVPPAAAPELRSWLRATVLPTRELLALSAMADSECRRRAA